MPNAADISRGKALWLYALHVLHVSPALLHVIDHFCPHSVETKRDSDIRHRSGSARTRRPLQSQSLSSKRLVMFLTWPYNPQMTKPGVWAQQISTHPLQKKHRDLFFRQHKKLYTRVALEPRDMFMWAWIPVYSSIFFCNKISFRCGENKQTNQPKSPISVTDSFVTSSVLAFWGWICFLQDFQVRIHMDCLLPPDFVPGVSGTWMYQHTPLGTLLFCLDVFLKNTEWK